MSYPGFKYEPVAGYAKPARRVLRMERKNMLRFFEANGFAGLAANMRLLRNNYRQNGDQKLAIFRRILDQYAAAVTPRAKEITDAEAAPAS
jgi:hypothetical protein